MESWRLARLTIARTAFSAVVLALARSIVIPGLAKREPGIHQAASSVVKWTLRIAPE